MESNKRNIKPFDGEKYSVWKFRVRALLSEINVLNVIDNDPPIEPNRDWIKKERKAKSIIIEHLGDAFLNFVKENTTAREIFKSLDTIYERKSLATQLAIRKKLLTLKLNSANLLQSHFIVFDNLISELLAAGAKIDEMDKVSHLLLTLPSSYNGVVTAIETLSEDNISLAFVKTRLLDHETKLISEAKDTSAKVLQTVVVNSARRVHKFNRNTKFNTKFNYVNNKNNIKRKVCFYCGKNGHLKKDCFKFINDNKKSSNKPTQNTSETNVAYVFMADSQNQNVQDHSLTFLIDSGATDHLTKFDDILDDAVILEQPIQIRVAKAGANVEATKKGTISLTTNEGINIVLKDVLYSKDISHNLLSVPKLLQAGCTVEFNKQGVTVCKDNVVVMHGETKNKLCYINFVKEFQSALCTSVVNQSELWHRRLGHIGNQKFMEIKNKNMFLDIDRIKMIKPKEGLCEACIKGKQSRIKFAKAKNKDNIQRPLFVVHTDVCGPITPTTVDNKNYFVIFVDQYTHYCATYLISKKSEVFEMFKDFTAKSEAHFNLKIVHLYSDNGREYLSQEMKDYCVMRGISYHLTIPYTPQLNGVSERMIRTITEKARAMLHDAGLPKEFWGEAVLTATYLINRTPSNALIKHNKMPYELWHGKKPLLKYLKVFGSTVHVLKKLRKSKFEEKSSKYVLVGYVPNGYRVWCVESGCFATARDVIVDENSFLKSSAWKSKNNENNEDLQTISSELTSAKAEMLKARENEDTYTESEKSERFTEDVNEHSDSELRRSKRLKKNPPVSYNEDDEYYNLSAQSVVYDIPKTYNEIKSRTDRKEWEKAINSELNSLLKNKTWNLVQKPQNKNIVDCRWVFTIKKGQTYKARLVAKGYSQEYLSDYFDTFAPVARITTLRIMLAHANQHSLSIHQMDVKTAFLNGKLDEEIYMKVPEGINVDSNLVCKLNKALYGLKQAARCWYQHFDNVIRKFGFEPSTVDRCLYYIKSNNSLRNVFLLLYVDDILIFTPEVSTMNKIKQYLTNNFEMVDMMEVKTFLGINIKMTNGQLTLDQNDYLKRVLDKFKMGDCNPCSTPLPTKLNYDELNSDVHYEAPCRELIGCLMYAMLCTRPDLCVSLNILSRYQNKNNRELWQSLKRILRYVKGTLDIKLVYKKDECNDILVGFVDADWASNETDRKSTTGYIFKYYNNTISWNSKKQNSVATSSTEAEYMALFEGVKEACWVKSVLDSVQIKILNPITIYEDNNSCIAIAKNPTDHKRSKHIDVKYHFTREKVEQKLIIIKHISTDSQLADMLTKSLPASTFSKMLDDIGMKTIK